MVIQGRKLFCRSTVVFVAKQISCKGLPCFKVFPALNLTSLAVCTVLSCLYHNENNCKLSFERGVDKETKATFRYQSDSMQRGVSFRILYFCRKESAGIHFASLFSLQWKMEEYVFIIINWIHYYILYRRQWNFQLDPNT